MSLLGIDVGTTGCKAVLFSEEGRILSIAYEEYDPQRPQAGWAELDTPRVWEQIQRTIRGAVAGAGVDPVKALSISSLGEAVVPVSRDRRILGPSLLNFDARGAEFLPDLQARMDPEQLYRINGNTLGNNYSLTKLLWVKKHQPELYRQADLFLHWGSFVAFMLGAEPATDYALANRTLLFDLQTCDWSEPLLDWAGFEREKLPPTVPPGKVIGSVSKAMAEALGLPAGLPIVSGAHDQCCNSVGCGVIEEGRALYGMGTYICIVPVFRQRPDSTAMIARGLNTEHHAAPGQMVSFIYNQGGALVKWFRDTFAALEKKQVSDIYGTLFAEMPPGPSRVMALPHFTVTGPPQFIDDSCGLLAGLYLETPRGEILKGLVEGATFYLRECLESLPEGIAISDFRAGGGGSKSDAWLQVSADILGRPFLRPQVNEAGSLGAAILAGWGSGVFPSIEAGVDAMLKWDREFQPDPAMQRRYDERFEKYRRLQPLFQEYLRDLAKG
jgi:xylulokinase